LAAPVLVPFEVFKDQPGPVTDVSAHNELTCAVRSGQPYCWGESDAVFSKLNLGPSQATPVLMAAQTDSVRAIAGQYNVCLERSGSTTCLGDALWTE